MNVRQLIDELNILDPEATVYISRDGNGFNRLSDLREYATEEESYSIEPVHPDDQEDDTQYFNVVVLWP